jgi:hypothetical protein
MICPRCGKRIVSRNGEYVNAALVDGEVIHKKCPKPKMSKEDAKAYVALRDQIAHYVCVSAKGYITQQGQSWKSVAKMIKEMKDQGYSYEDQLYALDKTVELQNGFYGYGSVRNNIERIMYLKNRKVQLKQETVPTKEVKKWEKKEDDYEW